jgi:phosphoribosylformylglycinamidine cyclo-ligase
MTYAATGVDYDAMDPFKRLAQLAGQLTRTNLDRFGFAEVAMSRGESAYLIETPEWYLAHVEEGLGTKNLVADAMYEATGKSYYDHVAQDCVAMITNDMITLGALPLSVAMHLAVGDSKWFDDVQRSQDLIKGWTKACDLSRCAWGGGETPTLKDIILPGTVVLSGSAMGVIRPKTRLITPFGIEHNDAIVLLESSGIHANGLTLARKIANKLPDGYLTKLADGRTYGETLLDPTHIYVGFVEDCLKAGVDIHYAVNITGHGWRKLMRATEDFTYIIEELPKELPIFPFLQDHGPISDKEAFGNLNMGAGFALYVRAVDVDKVLNLARTYPFGAMEAGCIRMGLERKVVIKPKFLTFKGESLGVR